MRTVLSLSVAGLTFLAPSLVYAHGDDRITVTSFIGPIVAFTVFVLVVGLGRTLIRTIIKKG